MGIEFWVWIINNSVVVMVVSLFFLCVRVIRELFFIDVVVIWYVKCYVVVLLLVDEFVGIVRLLMLVGVVL